jgi:CHAT domain-containing protein
MRPFEARLSGSRRWIACASASAPSPSTHELGCANNAVDPKILNDALDVMRKDRHGALANEERTRAATAIDLAASSRVEQLDEVIARFSETRAVSAAVLNDLAVAVFTRSAARHDASGAIDALETIEEAAHADSGSLVVRFNRALMLERVGLNDRAEAAWRDYARREADSDWVREALTHVQALEGRRNPHGFDAGSVDVAVEVSKDPQGARELVTDSLLGAWSRAAVSGDRAARDLVVLMRAIGAKLVARSGDSSALHVALECETATPQLAADVAAFARGAATFRRGNYASAEGDLADASRGLRLRKANAVADWTDILVGAAKMFQGDFVEADAIAKRVDRSASRRGDLALRARANWVLGLSAARQERTADAERYTSVAAEVFETIGERGNRAFMRAQLADIDFSLGRDDAWLEQKTAALSELTRERDVRRRYSLLADLGKQLSDLGRRWAGIAILEEAVRLSDRTGRPSDHAEALIRLAAAYFARGLDSAGSNALTEARQALAVTSDSAMRTRLEMEASTAAASAARANPSEAATYLSNVVAYFDAEHLRFSIARPLTQRASARLIMRDTTGALNDLKAAVALGQPKDDALDRDESAARSEAFRLLTAVQAARGDTTGALATVERSRGAGNVRHERAPPGTVGITYAVLRDETIMWVTTSKRVRMVRLPTGRGELDDLVSRYEARVVRHFDEDATAEIARRLFILLIAPADTELRSRGVSSQPADLVLSTDGPLTRLPFALLQDSEGRFLFERAAIRYSPMVTSPPPLAADRSRVVVVANPAFDPAWFADLTPLRGADVEGAAVARAYDHSRIVAKEAATRAALIAALNTATLVHFAGHARLVDRAPRLSHLVAAADGDGYEANIVSAADLSRLKLPQLSLVVLSSCGTTQRHSHWDMGRDGLSQALLNAGAGGVISSLWVVDDEEVTSLMEALHQRLAAGDSPPVALRAAELRMLETGRRGRAVSIGGIFRVETK